MFFFSDSSGAGKHWIGIHRNSYEETEYFDSLGVNVEFVKTSLPKYSLCGVGNETQLQPSSSDLCGQFVAVFLVFRLLNLDLSFEDAINALFSNNVERNQETVLEHLNSSCQI